MLSKGVVRVLAGAEESRLTGLLGRNEELALQSGLIGHNAHTYDLSEEGDERGEQERARASERFSGRYRRGEKLSMSTSDLLKTLPQSSIWRGVFARTKATIQAFPLLERGSLSSLSFLTQL